MLFQIGYKNFQIFEFLNFNIFFEKKLFSKFHFWKFWKINGTHRVWLVNTRLLIYDQDVFCLT